jgi:hypothetical protein
LKVACAALPLTYLLVPFTALLPTVTLRLAAAFLLNFVKLAGVIYAYPCMIILLTNSAPNLRVLGTLNGIATSVAALGRGIGPAFMGRVFTFGVERGYMVIPWTVLALLSVVSAAPLFWIVEPPGRPEEDEEDEEDDDDNLGTDEEDDDDISFGDEDNSQADRALFTPHPPNVGNGTFDGIPVAGGLKVNPTP